ncbi:MAG TPA: GNAT family N-acetyltransferase [Candidatus Limnocylindria bacterium]
MTNKTVTRVREFMPADREQWVSGANACYPDYPLSVEESRHQDETFDRAKYFLLRLVALDGDDIVGGVDMRHQPGRFHPARYWFDLWVRPEHRRRGHGTGLYDATLRAAVERRAIALNAGVKESMTDGVDFLRHRGWYEVKRDWESRLAVAGFDFAKFASADERIAANGITITTYADALRRDPEGAEAMAYELIGELRVDVPSVLPPTPETIEEWRRHWTGAPAFLPEAFFIAVDRDGRWIGMSNLERSIEDPSFVWQGLTGVRREARGSGVAMALKLRTVRYAQSIAVDHIKTWNDQRNRPMLSINEAMGFVKQPAWIAMELKLDS